MEYVRFIQTDDEIDQYIEATKHLARRESLDDLRARLRRDRDERLAEIEKESEDA